ncbi:MAG: hypothetical protein V5A60_09235 [Haloarculaceae archaeon]
MMDDIHIADGIAVKLLLAGIVLAGGAVGALSLAPATSQVAADGLAESPSAQLAFPIDNVSANSGGLLLSLDGKGNDPYPATFSIDGVTMAFPIDNVTAAFPIDNVTAAFPIDNVTAAFATGDASASGGPWDARDTDGVGSADANAFALALVETPDELPQDMDPY